MAVFVISAFNVTTYVMISPFCTFWWTCPSHFISVDDRHPGRPRPRLAGDRPSSRCLISKVISRVECQKPSVTWPWLDLKGDFSKLFVSSLPCSCLVTVTDTLTVTRSSARASMTVGLLHCPTRVSVFLSRWSHRWDVWIKLQWYYFFLKEWLARNAYESEASV